MDAGPSTEDSARKRSSRACDGCKQKRLKCEGLDDEAAQGSCRLCRENGEPCTFVAPVRKRGPAVGFKRRRRDVDVAHADETVASPDGSLDAETQPQQTSPASDLRSRSVSRTRPPLLGLPRPLVDELLLVYFTHVHNVWPLVYKPIFNAHAASPLLLLSMLAIAACVSPPDKGYHLDGPKLFRMAESALHHCRMENRVDIVQAMILLSLRQTGCGDKGAAFIYGSRACGMILNLGLNLAPKGDLGEVEEEIRSRVLWNAYVLDKTLAEETGRPFILPYRRCSTPFPSTDEMDELEVWPPPSISAALPRSVRGVVPRRGYVVSCFVWTCRLGMIVEDILDLDEVSQPNMSEWDRQFRAPVAEDRRAERIAGQLASWKNAIPKHLRVSALSPLPHHVIGLAWHATAEIMLHSRYVDRTDTRTPTPVLPNAHGACTAAARDTVELMRMLDKHGLLEQISSDVIHILSLATLFHAFDSTSTDAVLAEQAKRYFSQCCAWLRLFSSSWPAASAHKLFFEAVIQGGIKLSEPEVDQGGSPIQEASLLSPSLTGGLQAVRRHLSVSHAPHPAVPPMITPGPGLGANTAGAGGIMQLPQYFWNHLSTAAALPVQSQNPVQWEDMFDFGAFNDVGPMGGVRGGGGGDPGSGGGMGTASVGADTGNMGGLSFGSQGEVSPYMSTGIGLDGGMPGQRGTGFGQDVMNGGGAWAGGGESMGVMQQGGTRHDQGAISAALMRFMMDATKSA